MKKEDFQEMAEVERLRRELERANKTVSEMAGLHDVVREVILSALRDVQPPAMPKMPARSRRKRKEIAVIHLSDWQIGALTDSYNLTVAREMILGQLLDIVTKLVAERQVVSDVDECVVLLGGDMVDGSALRPTQAWEVESTVYTQAVHDCPRLMADFVLGVTSLFRKVHVECVRGNHGRNGAMKGNWNPSSVNWDSVAYETAMHMVKPEEHDGRITWHNEVETFYRIVPVGDHAIFLTHGDVFRGSGGFAGIPVYSIVKKMARWVDSIPDDWAVLMMGHYHNPTALTVGSRTCYINGTTKRGGEWELEELAMSTRPAQRLQFWDKKHGVKSDHVIWL